MAQKSKYNPYGNFMCKKCKVPFGRFSKNKYCSFCLPSIDKTKEKAIISIKPSGLNIPKPTIGAISELIVAADLMKKGWEVFRALSPSSNSDLVAIKNEIVLKLEVRTGTSIIRGDNTKNFYYPKTRTHGKTVAVVIIPDNTVHYIDFIP